jgi:hypothetical protein
MKDYVAPIRFMGWQLLFMVGGMGWIVYMAIPLPDSKLIGGFLLVIGMINVIGRKRFGSSFFAMTQSSWLLGARFWAKCGERGAWLMHLWIGIILVASGIILLLLGQS